LQEVLAPVILSRGVSESHHSKLGERFGPKEEPENSGNRLSVPPDQDHGACLDIAPEREG